MCVCVLQILLKKEMKSIEQYFCISLRFFRSVLVRYSAISSLDSRKRRFFFSLLRHKQLGYRVLELCATKEVGNEAANNIPSKR